MWIIWPSQSNKRLRLIDIKYQLGSLKSALSVACPGIYIKFARSIFFFHVEFASAMKYQWRSGFPNSCANYRAKDEVTKASFEWRTFQRAIDARSKRTIRNQTEGGESIRERERKRQLRPAMRHSSWSDCKLSQRPREQPKNPPIFQQSLRKIENSKVYDTVENVGNFLGLKYLKVLRKCIYCRKFSRMYLLHVRYTKLLEISLVV